MFKKYYNPLLFLFFLIFTFGACTQKYEDDTCISISKAAVIKIEGAGTALVNEEVILTVSFGCSNGCGQFGSFAEAITGNTTTITVNARYAGCICTQDAPIRKTLYKFKKSQAGIFDLKFFQTENTYLTHTIVVQ